MTGSKNTHIATLVDRKYLYTFILNLEGTDAQSVNDALINNLILFLQS